MSHAERPTPPLPLARLEAALAALPGRYPGPGGAVAVVHRGEVLLRHAWGWADAERRIPFTPRTHALICSITKQFTCSVLLDRFPDPTVLDDRVRDHLPRLEGERLGILDLANNQSGLRDYWATAMLCGSPAEAPFGPAEAKRLIGRTRSLHFAPGTRSSYCNQNFRILSDILEGETGQPFDALLRQHVFDRAGMEDAVLNPDTSAVAGGTVGYEGSVEAGFRPAVNRIHWTGDAGLAATLDDMIAWERFIDATRDEDGGLYRRLGTPNRFRDGTPAGYGFGLGRPTVLGRAATAHAGGLRGWRSFRCNLPAERLSVVVLFNHMADPRAAALDLLRAALDEPASGDAGADLPALPSHWQGAFEDGEMGLGIRLSRDAQDRLRIDLGSGFETLAPQPDGSAAGASNRLREEDGVLWLERPNDNLRSTLLPLPEAPVPQGLAGRYHCAELDATLHIEEAGGVLYAAPSGELGGGMMQPLIPLGGAGGRGDGERTDIWRMPCPRALDFAPPGDWTIAARRDGTGAVRDLRVGCWLARGLDYRRV
ncbi:D-aminopeptidase [Roseomonas elaeocarpi]|uniref:D-aminopeptidase n=1 Tax=Roseomonas elaeocarpi TaxID=907779 RepID=A0ABV6JMI1_9PROT